MAPRIICLLLPRIIKVETDRIMNQKAKYRRVYQSLYRNEDLSPENQVRRRLLSETFYDEADRVVEETLCNDTGEPEQLTSHEYNNDLLAKTITSDLLNDFSEEQHFEYNQAGQLMCRTLLFADGSEMVTNYQYDASGRLVERKQCDPEEGTCQLKTYAYEGDLLVALTETDEEGNLIESVRYRYDENNQRIAVEMEAGDAPGLVKTEYDDQGRQLAQRTYDTDERLIARSVWDYEDKFVRETAETIQGINITETTFDDAGRESSRKRTTPEGQILEQLTFAYHPDGRPDRTSGMQYTQAYDVIRFFSLDYEYGA